jgi:prevent-host-death family protein
MKTASISQAKNQLSALIDSVRHGESVIITDRDRPVARLVPVQRAENEEDEARLARLERAGLIRRGNPAALRELLKTPPPKLGEGVSVLEALLEERRNSR